MGLTTGIAAGGIAEGFDAGEKRALQERTLGLQEKGLGLKEQQLKFERFKKVSENIRALAQEAQKVKAARPDAADQFIAPLRRQVEISARAAAMDMGRPELAENMIGAFDALVAGTPNAVEAASTKGKATAAETAATVSGLEQIPGADPQAIRVKQGLALEPEKAQKPLTDAGKLVFDEELIARQYGADSPQMKAFKEASKTTGTKLTDQSALRNQYLQQSKDFVQVRDAFGKVAAATKNPSAAGDLALIFNFMKILDPGSVVREGEFATAQNAASVPDRVRNMYNRVMSGERLNPDQRQDFIEQAGNIFKSQLQQQMLLEKTLSLIHI